MNCKTTLEMLSAYLDRELATGERDAVRSHLAECEACCGEERDLRALKGLLLGVRAPEPAADFERRLMAGLRDEASLPIRMPRFALPRLGSLAWAPFGGLVVAGALTVLFVGRAPQPSATVAQKPTVRRETVARNDSDEAADVYVAYSGADDFAGGANMLTDAP